MFDVIRVVVNGDRVAFLLEPFDQKTLLVKVGEADRTNYLVQAAFLRPSEDRLKKLFRDLEVINDVETAETHLLSVYFLVIGVIYQGAYPADDLTVAIREEKPRLAILISRVCFWVEHFQFVQE